MVLQQLWRFCNKVFTRTADVFFLDVAVLWLVAGLCSLQLVMELFILFAAANEVMLFAAAKEVTGCFKELF